MSAEEGLLKITRRMGEDERIVLVIEDAKFRKIIEAEVSLDEFSRAITGRAARITVVESVHNSGYVN